MGKVNQGHIVHFCDLIFGPISPRASRITRILVHGRDPLCNGWGDTLVLGAHRSVQHSAEIATTVLQARKDRKANRPSDNVLRHAQSIWWVIDIDDCIGELTDTLEESVGGEHGRSSMQRHHSQLLVIGPTLFHSSGATGVGQ
jgi:hypothetical protein